MNTRVTPLCRTKGCINSSTIPGGLCEDCLSLKANYPEHFTEDAAPAPDGSDPNGLDAHAPGAKLDVGKPRLDLVLGEFPRALMAVGDIGTFGANKYSDSGWLSVDNGFQRYTDAMLRHYFKEKMGEFSDPESDMLHAAHLAWNALARLELLFREVDNQTVEEELREYLAEEVTK